MPWKPTIGARALEKLHRKRCDLVVLNGPEAMRGQQTEVEVIDSTGAILATLAGAKEQVAEGIFRVIRQRLIRV